MRLIFQKNHQNISSQTDYHDTCLQTYRNLVQIYDLDRSVILLSCISHIVCIYKIIHT